MVKLLRLTTDNNCKFNADLDAGINVGENASIALQNLTFESDFTVLDITGDDVVTFNWNTTSYADRVVSLTPRTYTKSDYKEFYPDLQRALNGTQFTNHISTAALIQKGYASFKVVDGADAPQIQYKFAPVCRLFHLNTVETERVDVTQLSTISIDGASPSVRTLAFTDASDKSNCGNISKNAASAFAANSALYNSFVRTFSGKGYIAKGNGMVSCNVNNLVDHAGASLEHGFAMGLSFNPAPVGVAQTELPAADRSFEIRALKTDEHYRFCTPTTGAGVDQISTVLPFQYDISVHTDPLSHDSFYIEKRGNQIRGRVISLRVGGGSSDNLFTHVLSEEDAEKPLYPYFYVNGANTNAVIGNPICVIEPLQTGNEEFQITGNTSYIDAQLNDPINIYKPNYSGPATVPVYDAARMTENMNNKPISVGISKKVAEFMGWSAEKINASPSQYRLKFVQPETELYVAKFLQFNLIPDGNSRLAQSDNFVIMLDSNPLSSYDASRFNYDKGALQLPTQNNRGRRLNILATLPVNDNTGIVEYDSSQLVYIDLDNKFPQVLKNMRIRVLDKNMNEINTLGTAVMTLLIQE